MFIEGHRLIKLRDDYYKVYYWTTIMPNFDTSGSKAQHYLLIVHDRVAGRTRIYVPGLYRNNRLRANLESRLTVLEEISRAHANTLTGNLLVEYKAPRDSREMPANIAQLLEAELGCPIIRHTESVDRPAKKIIARKPEKVRRRAEFKEYQAQPLQLWHTLSGIQAINFLQGSEAGLTQEAAAQRLMKYGPNLLYKQGGRSSLQIFLAQFVSAPVAMLGLSAVISLAAGGAADAAAIGIVILVNSVIGYVTEKSAEKTINALGQLIPETATVIRDGKRQEIPLPEVAFGDLLVLAPGSYIPADARLLASHRLTIDESPLTARVFRPAKTRNSWVKRRPLWVIGRIWFIWGRQ
jgi:Ca2+-transporting ATPase